MFLPTLDCVVTKGSSGFVFFPYFSLSCIAWLVVLFNKWMEAKTKEREKGRKMRERNRKGGSARERKKGKWK